MVMKNKTIDRWSIFIDYDNLVQSQKENLSGLVETILLQTIKKMDVKNIAIGRTRFQCHVRLYGGWHEEQFMTRSAQSLSTLIDSLFPQLLSIEIEKSKIRVIITAELALSLLEDPQSYLFFTYRRKGRPRNIKVISKLETGCTNPECLLPYISKILKNGKCPLDQCKHQNLIYRGEQKLVDTMLTCDLIFASTDSNTQIILVSSDDDFIPPIKTILLKDIDFFLFNTRKRLQKSYFNANRTPGNLVEVDL